MRYILNPYIALRSWMLVPYAYYIKGERNAKGLTAEEFAFLTECDGRSELPDEAESPLARKFLADGFIRKAENCDVLSDWSRPRLCPNRYFPAMNWMIIGKCNYNCIHCFNAADNAPLMSEWSMDEADRLLDQARDCGINAFTITGGEPMLQIDFLTELFTKAKQNGIRTALDTCGILFDPDHTEKTDKLMAVTDLVLLDIKHMFDEEHKKLTGHSNARVFAFAEYLKKIGKPVWIRHVVVPGITFRREELLALGRYLKTLTNMEKLEVLPYHSMGKVKYDSLGIEYPLLNTPQLTKAEAAEAEAIIREGMAE